MPDYESMFHLLSRSIAKALAMLQHARQECERLYWEAEHVKPYRTKWERHTQQTLTCGHDPQEES